MNEVHVLEAIEKTDEPTMTNIAKRLRITVGTLTTSMNRLVEKGKTKKQALIAVINKLIRQAFAIAKSKKEFDPNYEIERQKRG